MGKKVRPESRYTLKGWYLSKILKEEEIIHVYVLAENISNRINSSEVLGWNVPDMFGNVR